MSLGPKITAEQVDRMIELRRKCWTHQRIANELGITREAVCKHLMKFSREAFRRLEDRYVAEQVAQLDQLDEMAESAMDAWQSKKDAAVLGQARGALADKRSILGLDAPTKITPTDPDGSPFLTGFAQALKTAYGGGPAGPAALPDDSS